MSKGGIVCAVAGCRNFSTQRNDLSFHRFPADKTIRDLWIAKCQRKENWNPNTSRICSDHFAAEDFERDLRAELLGLEAKRRLKVGTIPSLNLIKQECSITSSDDIVFKEEPLNDIICKTEHEADVETLPIQVPKESPEVIPQGSQSLDPPPDFKVLYEQVKCENEDLRREIVHLKSELDKTSIKANKALQFSNALKQIFTPNEILIMTGSRKRVKWTVEEISKALMLRYLSKRAYIYFRNQMKFPLPGISTLKRQKRQILSKSLKVAKVSPASKDTVRSGTD